MIKQVWQTDDGKVFPSKEKAEQWERELPFRNSLYEAITDHFDYSDESTKIFEHLLSIWDELAALKDGTK